MNTITNWQCIAPIFSLNFINANKHNRMTKLQIVKQKTKRFSDSRSNRLLLRCSQGVKRWCVFLSVLSSKNVRVLAVNSLEKKMRYEKAVKCGTEEDVGMTCC